MLTREQVAELGLVSFCDDLAKKNSESLSFIPLPRLEQYANSGHILYETENDELCGFLILGSGWPILKVYQACVQYDARFQQHGLSLVEKLICEARFRGCDEISLRCASDLSANAFWMKAGFSMIGNTIGGKRRGRILNVWRMKVGQTLFQPNL